MGAAIPSLQAGLLNQSSAQVIDGSLKFDSTSSNYLNRTPSSASNRKTWTWSGWVKKTGVGTQSFIFSCMPSGSYFQSYFSADKLYLQANTPTFYVETTQVFRDLGWYHIVIVLDTPQTDPTDRLKLYVNGEEASFGTDQRSSLTQNSDLRINDTQSHSIGSQQPLQGVYANFNLSQIYFIDGQALGCGYFGFTDPLTNTWRPKKVRQGDPTANDGRTWSDSSNLTNITNGAGAFDGDLTGGNYAYATGAGNSGTINFSNLTSVSTLRLYAREDSREASGKITVNSTDFDFPTTAAWVDVSSALSGGLSSITLKNGSYLTALFAIEVDGVVLRNGITTNLDFGTNGFYLPMDNDDFHIDKSGKGNNWTKQNFSGTSIDPDVLKDSPSGAVSGGRAQTGITTTSSAPSNYATMNPLDGYVSTKDGNLETSTSSGWQSIRATLGMNSGKFYWETQNNQDAAAILGIADSAATGFVNGSIFGSTGHGGGDANPAWTWAGANYYFNATTGGTGLSNHVPSDVVQYAFDADSGKLWFGRNGVWYNSSWGTTGNPAGGSNATVSGINTTKTYLACASFYNGSGKFNFGQKPFKYAPPQGYLPLNSASATPETVITRPNQFVGTTLYTGNNGTQNINAGLKPDFVWIKNRSSGATDGNHLLFDTIRGVQNAIYSNLTDDQDTLSNSLTSFNSDGFTVGGPGASGNIDSQNYVAWTWKAGGNKNTFNKDDVGYASAADVNMSVGSISSAATNSAQTWSSNITTTGNSGNWYPSFPATYIFDADTSNYGHANGDGSVACVVTLSFSPAVTCNLNVTLYGGLTSTPAGGGGTISINGGTAVALTPCATTNPAATDATVVPFSGSISSIVITKTATGGEGLLIYGFEIDGIRLTDNTAFTIPAVPSIANTGASVGTKQGFSIVTWDVGSLNGTLSLDTGLTKAPDFVITKVLDHNDDWLTFHKDLSSTESLILNGTRAKASNAAYAHTFNSNGTISGLVVPNWWIANKSYVFYSWHNVPGLQKFGKYTANNSSDGVFVELGFKPKILLIKNYDSTGDWIIWDSARNPVNPVNRQIWPYTSSGTYGAYDQVGADYPLDFLSNGFKMRTTDADMNGSSRNYIYAAWAESPVSNLYGGQSNAR